MIEESPTPPLPPHGACGQIAPSHSTEIHDTSHCMYANLPVVSSIKKVPKKRCGPTKERHINLSLTFRDYVRSGVQLKTYKVAELKAVAKYNRLHITGNKPTLIQRIEQCFQSNVSAVVVQKYLRRFFVRRSYQLRGPAFRARGMCVNETDFFTLEPLAEIPWQAFYSYTDDAKFTYGFNVCSLMTLLKRKGSAMVNPYNRAKLPESVVADFIRLYLYMITLYSEHINEEDADPYTRNNYAKPVNVHLFIQGYYHGFYPERGGRALRVGLPPATTTTTTTLNPREPPQQNTLVTEAPTSRSPGSGVAVTVEHLERTMARIQDIRTRSLVARMQELFMEIDQLGNYTDARWFQRLSKRQCFMFYGHLYDTWRYRARIPQSTKLRVCPLGDPFMNVMPMRMRIDEVTEDEIRAGCLTVMENMVYTAQDVEDRKLGALYVLMSLTFVSLEARHNLMWLYESIVA